jgi:Fanconi anemia group M protein
MDFLQNIEPREYQKKIFETCINKNCLVVLPTGLGKTLIALMLTIERMKKFPKKKVLILAPTRPLAEQHLNYFKKNLPELFGEMQLFTGNVSAEKRKKIWDYSDIIFSTPQCISNDVKKNLYNLKEVCLLIEDEAHRCVKNYSYTFVAKKYLEQAEDTRIIGLTASPGSNQQKITEICKNLSIQEVELRTRESSDVAGYLQELKFKKIEVEFPKQFEEIRILLKKILSNYTSSLKTKEFYGNVYSKIGLLELQKKLSSQISRNYKNRTIYQMLSDVAQAIKISHAIELLETQTIESLMTYLKSLYEQASKKQSKGVVELVKQKDFTLAFSLVNELFSRKIEHPKMNQIIEIIRAQEKGHKRIIFTQYRETAQIISRKLNEIQGIETKIFIGQAKKKETGLNQKEQKQIIEDFKNNKINVLCSTSIGEEGLDIPEVNAVIFYEPVSSAIRLIQRRGRTARLNKGELIILVTKNTKDETSYYASRAREKKMQTSIEKIKTDLKNGDLEKNSVQKKLF